MTKTEISEIADDAVNLRGELHRRGFGHADVTALLAAAMPVIVTARLGTVRAAEA